MKTRHTKSRKWDNPTLYEEYGETHDCSELAYFLNITFERRGGKYELVYVPEKCRREAGYVYRDMNMVRVIHLESHHLWSVRTRPDVRSNLLRVTNDEHAWLESNKTAGRVLAMLAKLRARAALESPAEFSFTEMREVFGRHFDGWVGTLDPFTGELAWVDRYRRECKRLAKIMAGEETQ